jgi:uncharacterized repeat protein (TIGR03803 family)
VDGSALSKAPIFTFLDPLDAANRADSAGSLALAGTALYGMTTMGGAGGKGTIFRFDTEKNIATVLHSFAGGMSDGASPGELLTMAGTALYGMTPDGGERGKGTIFKFDTEKRLETVLHSFAGGTNDGASPYGSLTLVGATFYGTTSQGGAHGKGAIFKLDPKENVPTIVYSFAGGTNDGAYPFGSLTLSGTTLYGMTNEGGAIPGPNGPGLGTIFKFDTEKSVVTVLYSFAGPPNDGASPFYEPLTIVGEVIYGVTYHGGAGGKGTIFELDTKKNVEKVLHSFAGGSKDGAFSCGALTRVGTAFYGTTSQGGSGSAGTIFKFDSRQNFTVLHSFAGGANDGAYPYGSLTLLGKNLYGLTHGGGAGGAGTIFKFDTDKSRATVLHSFKGGPNDGAYPFLEPLALVKPTLYGVIGGSKQY